MSVFLSLLPEPEHKISISPPNPTQQQLADPTPPIFT